MKIDYSSYERFDFNPAAVRAGLEWNVNRSRVMPPGQRPRIRVSLNLASALQAGPIVPGAAMTRSVWPTEGVSATEQEFEDSSKHTILPCARAP